MVIRKTLQLEGLAIFLIAISFWGKMSGNWWLFLILFFTPDISMLGYLKDKKLGAMLYNLVHNFFLAFIILALGEAILNSQMVSLAGIILFAHVGLDRFLGFGLKYPTGFKSTHFQKL